MVTQCSTGFVVESFKQSVVWPSAAAMPGRFSSKQSTRDMRQRFFHKTRQLCFGPIPSVTWFCDWYIVCAFGSRIWPLCGRNYSRRMTRIQAEISCILTTFCDIFQMRGVKKWHTQQWHQLDEIAKWGVTLADLKKGCQAHAKRWLNFPLTISGFGFILNMIRYCTYVKSWCFQDLGIPEDKVEMLFQSLQPTPGRFTACFCIVYWVFWLVSIGIKCNVMRSERHLIFVGLGWHVRPQPSNFKPHLGKLIRSFKFLRSAFFWFVGGYLDLPLFCQATWPLLLPGHFSKTLGEEEAKAPAKAAWEIIENNINRLAIDR